MNGRPVLAGMALALLVIAVSITQPASAQSSEVQMMEAVKAASVSNARARQLARHMENENAALEDLIDQPPPAAARPAGDGLSGAQSANQAGQRCIAEQQRLDGELARATAVLLPHETVERLATLRTYSLRMRDAWLPCNEARAATYARVAADALRTCEGIASDASPCAGIDAMNASRHQKETAAAFQRLGQTVSDVIQQRRTGSGASGGGTGSVNAASACPEGSGMTSHGCHKGAIQ